MPNFTINGKYEIAGAEEGGTFLQAFAQIKDDTGDEMKVDGNNAC